MRAGESISFDRPAGRANLTPDTRKELMRHAQAKEWTEEAALRVRIPEADKGRNSFEMELSNGTKLKAELSDLYQSAILDAFGSYNSGRDEYVLIQGILRKDRDNHLKCFESIEHVTPLDPLDIDLRLEKLSQLKEGWLDGKGLAPASEQLDWLAGAFDTNFDADLPLPYLYPTAEGGIQAEWTLNEWAVSLEIELERKLGTFQALNLQNDTSTEHIFPLDNPEGWSELNEALKALERRNVAEQARGL